MHGPLRGCGLAAWQTAALPSLYARAGSIPSRRPRHTVPRPLKFMPEFALRTIAPEQFPPC